MSETLKGRIWLIAALLAALAYCDHMNKQDARDAKCRAAIRSHRTVIIEQFCR